MIDLFDPVGEPGIFLVEMVEIEAAQAQRPQAVRRIGAVAEPLLLHIIEEEHAERIAPGGLQIIALNLVAPELPILAPPVLEVVIKIRQPEDRGFADKERDVAAGQVVVGIIADLVGGGEKVRLRPLAGGELGRPPLHFMARFG